MKKLLFIDATVRPEEVSRTWRLCQVYLEEWKKQNPDGVVRHLRLRDESLCPSLLEDVESRERLSRECKDIVLLPPQIQYSYEFADADEILIGAPYWDLSFPSMLRVYLEKLCLPGVTFRYTERGVKPLCKASGCVYITSCGGRLGRNLGGTYIHELCDNLFGIKKFRQAEAEGLDMDGADVEQIMEQAVSRVRRLARG